MLSFSVSSCVSQWLFSNIKQTSIAWYGTPKPNPVWRINTPPPVLLLVCCCISRVIPPVRTCWETPSQILRSDISFDRVNGKYTHALLVTHKQAWMCKQTLSILNPNPVNLSAAGVKNPLEMLFFFYVQHTYSLRLSRETLASRDAGSLCHWIFNKQSHISLVQKRLFLYHCSQARR